MSDPHPPPKHSDTPPITAGGTQPRPWDTLGTSDDPMGLGWLGVGVSSKITSGVMGWGEVAIRG